VQRNTPYVGSKAILLTLLKLEFIETVVIFSLLSADIEVCGIR